MSWLACKLKDLKAMHNTNNNDNIIQYLCVETKKETSKSPYVEKNFQPLFNFLMTFKWTTRIFKGCVSGRTKKLPLTDSTATISDFQSGPDNEFSGSICQQVSGLPSNPNLHTSFSGFGPFFSTSLSPSVAGDPTLWLRFGHLHTLGINHRQRLSNSTHVYRTFIHGYIPFIPRNDNTHLTHLRLKLGWLLLSSRRHFQLLTLFYKVVCNADLEYRRHLFKISTNDAVVSQSSRLPPRAFDSKTPRPKLLLYCSGTKAGKQTEHYFVWPEQTSRAQVVGLLRILSSRSKCLAPTSGQRELRAPAGHKRHSLSSVFNLRNRIHPDWSKRIPRQPR